MGWVQIEQNLIPEIPLQSIIFLGKVHWKKIKKKKKQLDTKHTECVGGGEEEGGRAKLNIKGHANSR